MQRTKNILCLILALGLTLCATAAFGDEAACRESFDSWVEKNGQSLPTTLDELTALDRMEQRYAFAVLSPAERAEIWRAHLEGYLETHRGELDRSQIAVLDLAVATVSTRLFQTPANDPAYTHLVKRPLEKLTARAYEVFSDEQLAEIFFDLGSAGGAAPTKAGSCNCNHAFDCQGRFNPNGYCIVFGFDCIPVNYGCGLLWLFGCEGKCSL